MDWSIISVVEISFNEKLLSDNELQVIEELFRKDNNVDNLNVHPRQLTFYIWGKDSVDYDILDKVKDKLKIDDYLVEYFVFTGHITNYAYNALDD